MSDEPKKWLRTWTWISVALLAMLAMYVLSFGPAYVLCAKSDSDSLKGAFNSAYSPIFLGCQQNETFNGAIQCWVDVWQGPPPPPEFPWPQPAPNTDE